MEIKKRPVGMMILIIFFAWHLFKSAETFFMYNMNLEYQLWSYSSMPFVGYFFGVFFITLTTLLIYLYAKRKKAGYYLSFYFFGSKILYGLIKGMLIKIDSDFFKEIVLKSRIERGLSTKAIDEVTNFILDPSVGIILLLIGVLFYLGLAYYVYKRKDYFSK